VGGLPSDGGCLDAQIDRNRKNRCPSRIKRKRRNIYAEVQQLANWPNCPGDIKRLQGRDDYRLRTGDQRVIFEIDQSGTPIIVTITRVEKRNERTY
jgi:mRNA interferase RelE/StbE